MRKILFLDVDGVMNSEETLKKTAHRFQGVLGIDPYLALLVYRIIEATGCEVVLSSSWRGHADSHEYIEKAIGHKLHDITGRCCTGIRGAEIYQWLNKNIPYTERDDLKYAILDDDSDMLLNQEAHFFKTSWKEGITEEIAQKVIDHLNSGQTGFDGISSFKSA